MAISFLQAPTFNPGESISAIKTAQLADSINSRLRSGLGDMTQRLHLWLYYGARQVRIPGDLNFWGTANLWPSAFEYQGFYSHIDDESLTWPKTSVGSEEGANPASCLPEFITGLVNQDVTPLTNEFGKQVSWGEGDGLNKFMVPSSEGSPFAMWDLAKRQRGLISADGTANAPMLSAGQWHKRISFPNWSNHGKVFSSYLPSPEILETKCSQDLHDGNGIHYFNSYKYIFSYIGNISGSNDAIYNGTCGPAAGGNSTDLMYVADLPYSYYVYLWNGSVDILSKTEYIKSYSGGGRLQRDNGNQIDIALNLFVNEFRGTVDQLSGNCVEGDKYSFFGQGYFNAQNQLSPNYATLIDNQLYPEYSGSVFDPNDDTHLIILSGSASDICGIPIGFRHGGTLIRQVFLDSTASINLYADGELYKTLIISPDTASIIYTHDAGATGSYQYEFAHDVTVQNEYGEITLEDSILLDSKPNLIDAYTILRMSSAKSSTDEEFDQTGIDYTKSRTCYDLYKKYGCMVTDNVSVQQTTTAINTNPIMQAWKRFNNKISRVVHGYDMGNNAVKMLVGYEVLANQHSVLYFKRYQSHEELGSYSIDSFKGIISPNTGSENGIKNIADSGSYSYSNEWLMHINLKPYRDDAASRWKSSVYGNYFFLINRGMLEAPTYRELSENFNTDLYLAVNEAWSETSIVTLFRTHAVIAPECVSAYTYAGGGIGVPNINTGCNADFYSSCQIYRPDPEIISSSYIKENGKDIVRIELDRRLQYHPSASITIDRDMSTWNWQDIEGQSWRTEENGIQSFLMMTSDNPSHYKTGDYAYNSSIPRDDEHFDGCVLPTFYFSKLVSKPYIPPSNFTSSYSCSCLDPNLTLVNTDQLTHIQAILQSCCGGYIDGYTSVNMCTNDSNQPFYDYTYNNLVIDATGNSPYLNAFDIEDRPDKPEFFGPVVGSNINAQTLNQFSNCINKLTMVRLPIPFKIETKATRYETLSAAEMDLFKQCSESEFARGIKFVAECAEASTITYATDWGETGNQLVANRGTNWNQTCADGDANFVIINYKTDIDYRFNLIDPLAWNAISPDIAALITSTGQAGFYARIYEQKDHVNILHTTNIDEVLDSCDENNKAFYSDDSGYWYGESKSETTSNCVFLTNGTLSAPSYCAGGFLFGINGGNGACVSGPEIHVGIDVKNTSHLILNVPTSNIYP